jgi:hypothetical protein
MAMAFEYRGNPEDEAVRRARRMVGTIVVPGEHITRIEIREAVLQGFKLS